MNIPDPLESMSPGEDRDPALDQPAAAKPPSVTIRMDDHVEFSDRLVGSRTMVVAHHVATGKFFQLGPEEYRIASLLDGRRGMAELMHQIQADGMTWEAADVANLIQQFVASGLAHHVDTAPQNDSATQNESGTRESDHAQASQASFPPAPASPAVAPEKPKPGWRQRLPQLLSLCISQRIPLMYGDRLAMALERRVGWIFSFTGVLAWSTLVASGLLIVFGHHDEFRHELQSLFDPAMWLVLLAFWLIAKVLHELGHAVAARYHGVRVGKIGVMFFLFAPLAYVDVTDAWKLRSRIHRVQIALGGVYVELACAAVAAWAWWYLPAGVLKHLSAQFFLVAGPATLLVNANPLLRLDGYYVVSDLTDIANLRMHGRRQLSGWIDQWLVRIPAPRAFLSGWRRPFATTHALASIAFQALWMSGLVIGVSMWAKGFGMVLAAVAVTLWVILPLFKWLVRVWSYPGERRWWLTHQQIRLSMLVLFLATSVPSISMTRSPLDRRVPVVVQFCDEQIVRAATDSFVTRVGVVAGQRVERGEFLIQLSNPDLELRRDQLADDLQLAEVKAVQLRRLNQLSQCESELQKAASLGRQVAELDEQLALLRVVADRDGCVIGRGVDTLPGRFVHHGDELMRVADPQEKELLASVGPSDVDAYRAATAQSMMSHVRLRGGASFQTTPVSLRPRARQTVPHPALAANVGGPIPVEPSPNPDQPWQVVQPQMESVTRLDPITSSQIQSGQIGTMTIRDNQTFIHRLWNSLQP